MASWRGRQGRPSKNPRDQRTKIIGRLRLLLELVPECKPLFQISEGHRYYAMLFGVPAVRFHRTAQRGGSATVQKIRKNS